MRMRTYSIKAWEIASQFKDVLASDTSILAILIDEALNEEREECAEAILKRKIIRSEGDDNPHDPPP